MKRNIIIALAFAVFAGIYWKTGINLTINNKVSRKPAEAWLWSYNVKPQ